MYREFIEHPWSIPDDIHARLDLRSGSDRGRIYRLAPAEFQPRPFVALGKATPAELVASLASPRAWYRETAQRLLVERGDKSAVPALSELAKSERAQTVVHALWTLRGLDALTIEHVSIAMKHASPHVVEQAIRLAEPYLASHQPVQDMVIAKCSAPTSRVRLQAALSLGSIDNENTLNALAYLAERDGADPWMRSALCSAAPALVPKLLQRLLKQPTADGHDSEAITDSLLQTSAAMNDPASVAGHTKTGS